MHTLQVVISVPDAYTPRGHRYTTVFPFTNFGTFVVEVAKEGGLHFGLHSTTFDRFAVLRHLLDGAVQLCPLWDFVSCHVAVARSEIAFQDKATVCHRRQHVHPPNSQGDSVHYWNFYRLRHEEI